MWMHRDSWLKAQFCAILEPNTNAQIISLLSHLLCPAVSIFGRDCYSLLCSLYEGVPVPSSVLGPVLIDSWEIITSKEWPIEIREFSDILERDLTPDPCTPLLRDTHPLQHTPTLTPVSTMLAPTDMQESSLSHNEFALFLRSLLRPSSALSESPCEFTTCMRALIPSTVPACLRSLPGPACLVSKWIWIVYASANAHLCFRRR